MNIRKFEAIASVVGAVVLFVSWSVQQLLFESWNSSLGRIAASEAVFHSYRANDGLFRALSEVAPLEKRPDVERHQQTSYEKGLQVLALTVDSDLYAAERKRGEETLGDGITLADLNTKGKIMVEFDAMQRTLSAERARLSNRKGTAEAIFLSLYALGTLFLIAAGIARFLEIKTQSPSKTTPNPSIERTRPGKPRRASHVKR